ncbi:MAG: sulfoxide reductase heme-binding subunit YedZ [Gammaproteobacteria bacterium]|nr:sulfoxide reductase heme-binding subunit YedZ [Gammaproteobacteria bacterium]MDH5345127.1 sulfoxide reductase heme-binding subunit YedZ [Gammaproteobacteria bacterium]
MNTLGKVRFVWKPLVFALCLVPFLKVVGDLYGFTGTLGANPIEDIQDRFGNWGLRFLVVTLTVTPLRLQTGWNWLARFRRMLGLFAFFYVLMHFLVWLLLDHGLVSRWLGPAAPATESIWSAIAEDIFERPFITIGFIAFLALFALAATSTAGMRRRLGRRWQKLHRVVYIAAILGVWHYWWQVKLDVSDPLIYAAILAILLLYRIRHRYTHQKHSPA